MERENEIEQPYANVFTNAAADLLSRRPPNEYDQQFLRRMHWRDTHR